MSKKQANPMSTYYDLMLMNGGSYVFQIATRMGFLQAFKNGEKLSAKEVASLLNYQQKPSFLILETLESLGMFEREILKDNSHSSIDDKFSLTKVAAFLTGNYQNLSADYWEHLPTLLKEGTPYKKMDALENSENEYQVQVKALEWMLTDTAKLAAENFYKENKFGLSILDVGAGSGVWSFAMAYQDSSAKVTLADWPAVLEVANGTAEKNNIIDRVTEITGDFHQTKWPMNYFDVCTLGNVTHILTAEANKKIFKKIFESLNSNGELLIYDVISDREEGSLARSLYKLGLCIRTVSGQVYQPDIMKVWLKEVGFSSFRFESIDIEPYSVGVLKARKTKK
jgi:ubiquinone/menaquinone biosynthesis C-methylase UbiE